MSRLAALALLLLPTVLGFFAGGFREPQRLLAGIAVWLLVAGLAVAAPRPFPRGRPALLALGGLTGLLILTIASFAWAPLLAPAYGDAQRLALYLGALLAATVILRGRETARLAEPVLAFGACVVVAEGLSERVVPWLVTLDRSISAGGRLEQPLGYWNAMGALAAIALVLCAGLAGDPDRPRRLRAAAVAAAPLLGTAIALAFSRGALLCAGAGLVVLVLARPTRGQLASAVVAVAGAAVAGVLAASLGGVTDPARASDGQGALLLAVIVAAGAGAAVAQLRLAGGVAGPLPVALRRAIAAAGAVAVIGAGVLLLAADQGARTGGPAFGADAGRLASTQSNRYEYWDVALRTWADHPVLGAGSGAFGVEWLRERTVAEGARDAHSLPIETLAELGLLGLLALAALIAGVVLGARAVPAAAYAGAFGGMAAWAVHAAIDWAWEMPAVSLVALLLAGLVLAAAP